MPQILTRVMSHPPNRCAAFLAARDVAARACPDVGARPREHCPPDDVAADIPALEGRSEGWPRSQGRRRRHHVACVLSVTAFVGSAGLPSYVPATDTIGTG